MTGGIVWTLCPSERRSSRRSVSVFLPSTGVCKSKTSALMDDLLLSSLVLFTLRVAAFSFHFNEEIPYDGDALTSLIPHHRIELLIRYSALGVCKTHAPKVHVKYMHSH